VPVAAPAPIEPVIEPEPQREVVGASK
jgi:hypothetical protein